MTASEDFRRLLGRCPLVAILRGLAPEESPAIARAIFDSGIRILEVPLNGKGALASIAAMAAELEGEDAMIGAGTVLDPADVARVHDAGGRLIVSPGMRRDVVRATIDREMLSCPGFFTPTEAFEALRAGAHALKYFPAEAASPAVLRSMKAVLPNDVPIMIAGGVTAGSLPSWLASGAGALGLGSGLWKPGQDPKTTAERARSLVAACNESDGGRA